MEFRGKAKTSYYKCLRFTASDNLFGIFRLVLLHLGKIIIIILYLHASNIMQCITLLSPVFAHTYCTCQNCKIIGKVNMETTGMWGLTLIILKDIIFFQIGAYFEGIGINFNFENIQNKIFPLFMLRTIQSMHARYHRTLQHLSKIEGWFVYTSFSLKC